MTQHFGLIAHPAEHSLSPAMHNAAFKALGIDATFEAFDVSPNDLQSFLKTHQDYDGFAVSLPHKETIGQYLAGLDHNAQTIGAVNTLYKKESAEGDNTFYGTNTDAPGFLMALKKKMPNLAGKRALILGAGGAARAVVATLVSQVDSVTIINRTIPKGVQLAEDFGCRYGGKVEDLTTETPDLMVNATSVGLDSNNEPELVPQDFLKPQTLIVDLVYVPGQKTRLIQEAEKAGCPWMDGREMLLQQGMLQFKLWTGQDAPEEVMRATLEA